MSKDTTPVEIVEAQELVIRNMKPGEEIEANFDELKVHIERIVADYTDLVITEAYVPQAKKDRAFLNSLSTSLNQRRKDVKARYMTPVVLFEARVAELDRPIKAASAAIDEQVKAFEATARDKKRDELVKHYEEYAGALADAVPFERIEDARWLNQGVNLMAAFQDIEEIVERIAREEGVLTDMPLAHPVEAKAEYFATLDISRAIARSKDLEAQMERTRALEASKAEYARQREEDAKVATPAPAPAPAPSVIPPVPMATTPADPCASCEEDRGAACSECVYQPEEVEVREWAITVTCTRDQALKIAASIKAMGLSGTILAGGLPALTERKPA